jgi:hypothetical protein
MCDIEAVCGLKICTKQNALEQLIYKYDIHPYQRKKVLGLRFVSV